MPACRAMSIVEATPARRRDRADHRVTVARDRDQRCHPTSASTAIPTSSAGHDSACSSVVAGSAASAPHTIAGRIAPRVNEHRCRRDQQHQDHECAHHRDHPPWPDGARSAPSASQ